MAEARSYNAAVDFVDRNVAEGRGGKTAFRDPCRSLTYDELRNRVHRVGPALAELGVEREHRVVMLMLDTVDFPVVFWGAIRAGIVPVQVFSAIAGDPDHASAYYSDIVSGLEWLAGVT